MGHAVGKGGGFISEDILSAISSCSVIRSPDLYFCHRCQVDFPIDGSADWLKTLDSQWRVVLLCGGCFSVVRSARVCSYCFSWFPFLEKGILDCNICSRRVHRSCVPQHHRNYSDSLLDAVKFICVDCCPIPQLPRGYPEISGGSASQNRVLLEDLVRGASSISEKVTSKGEARENLTNEVIVTEDSSKVKSKEFGVVPLVRKPSYINFTDLGESVALPTINDDLQSISWGLGPNGASQLSVPREEQCSYNSVARTLYSNSCAQHDKIDACIENKSFPGDKENSESILTSSSLITRENGNHMKKIKVYNAGCSEDFSLNVLGNSIKLTDYADDSSIALQPCSLNTGLNNISPLANYRFGDCAGGPAKLKRKSTDEMGPGYSMKKYFRKKQGSERVMQKNSHSLLSNSTLLKWDNGDILKQNIVCSTDCTNDFSMHKKDSSRKFSDFVDDDSNDSSKSLPHYRLNTFFNSTMLETKHIFVDSDRLELPKLQRKSIDEMGSGRPLKRYFRKCWAFGRIMEEDSHSILTSSSLLKLNDRFLMKETTACTKSCPKDFNLKENGSSLKFQNSSTNLKKAGPTLLPYHSLNLLSNSSTTFTDYKFCVGDGERSSKLQRMSFDKTAYKSMKKYFRKHCSSKRIMKGSSESHLCNTSIVNMETEELAKQIRLCTTCYTGVSSFKGQMSSLKFSCYNNDGSVLLPCDSLSSSPNKHYRFGDDERFSEVKRKCIDVIDSINLKKYYRKRWRSKKVLQGNSQSIFVNNPLLKRDEGDLMQQTIGCSTFCSGNDALKEKISPIELPNSTDDGSIVGSALLQFQSLSFYLKSTMPLKKYSLYDDDGESCSKLQRRSIDAIISDGSFKKYFRKHLGSG